MADNEKAMVDQITGSLRSLFGDAKPETIFSEPESVGNTIVFTASAWERAGGFGFGRGEGPEGEGEGGGGGGGGSSQGRPVAVIQAGPGGVKVEPVIDLTKIGVTFLFAAAGWLTMRRRSGA